MSSPSSIRGMVDKLSGTKALVPTLFIIGTLVLAVAGLLVKLVFMRRKAAKLQSQVRMAEERRKQAFEDEKLARNAADRAVARNIIAEAEEEMEDLEEEMEARRVEHRELVDGLQAVSTWDDVVVVDKREKP